MIPGNPRLQYLMSTPFFTPRLFCHLRQAALIFIVGAWAGDLSAQVPGLINYQGRVSVGTTLFDGTGQFKFALVNAAGTTTFWSNDGSSTAGSQPVAAVSRTVTKGVYAVMLGDTTVINMTTTVSAAVFSNPDVRLRVWFNDGTNGFQMLTPDQRITSVGYAMMAAAVPDGAVTSANLAVGAAAGNLGNGSITSSHLAPGAALGNLGNGSVTASQLAPGAAAASLSASGQLGVPAGGMIASYDSAATSLTNAGYVRISEVLTPDGWTPLPEISGGATIVRPVVRAEATAVWTGSEMIVWGGRSEYNGTQLNTGECFNPATNSWRSTLVFTGISPDQDAPSPRAGHTAVWTGTEMIIWGGNGSNTGGRYNPVTNTWSATATTTGIPANDAPEGRSRHTAVWTGSQMIIWGGDMGGPALSTGGRYTPATNTWTATNAGAAPSSRYYHTAVWTGTQMIIWGGRDGLTLRGDGGIYTPSANSWSNIPASTFSARARHTAVWSGSRMLLWGGDAGTGMPPNEFAPVGDGASYNPAGSGTWSQMSFTNAPAPRFGHTVVWTDTEMMVWGGSGQSGFEMNPLFANGGRYNPASDTWTVIAAGPSPRISHAAVWTGSEMIIAGGFSQEQMPIQPTFALSDYWRFNPTSSTWTSATAASGLLPRDSHTAVWTGSEMIVWGGQYQTSVAAITVTETLGSGARYNPATNLWSPISGMGSPSPRLGHTAVWTGTEMIVWGGQSGNPFGPVPLQTYAELSDGGRYNPATNTWLPVSLTGAPSARSAHTATWTGGQMVVWGGLQYSMALGFTPLATGARYSPALDTWTSVSSTAAPTARKGHTAVWTGAKVLVWGGVNDNMGTFYNDGAGYDPTADTWSAIPKPGTPALPGTEMDSRFAHTAVWTGTEMIIWGGQGPIGDLNFGRYNPTSNAWVVLPSASFFGAGPSATEQPFARANACVVWTGKEMIVWGGGDPMMGDFQNTGGVYDPVTNVWVSMPTSARPSARNSHTAVWTGSKMLIFGGYGVLSGIPGGQPVSLGSLTGYSPAQRLFLYQKP